MYKRQGQTPASVLSVICEAFTCLPSDALRENPLDVIAILDARAAKAAKDSFNKKATDMPESLMIHWKDITDAMREKGYLE